LHWQRHQGTGATLPLDWQFATSYTLIDLKGKFRHLAARERRLPHRCAARAGVAS